MLIFNDNLGLIQWKTTILTWLTDLLLVHVFDRYIKLTQICMIAWRCGSTEHQIEDLTSGKHPRNDLLDIVRRSLWDVVPMLISQVDSSAC